MAIREFPLVDAADQRFSVNLAGKRTTWRFRYNTTTDRWSFDLQIGDTMMVMGRRVVLHSDLLAGYRFDIGAVMAIDVAGPPANTPDRRALPERRVRIYHEDP